MSKKQKNLHNFFQIQAGKSIHRKYFIYEPEHYRARFDTQPDANDKFVIRKSGLQLYVRPFSSELARAETETVSGDLVDLTDDLPERSLPSNSSKEFVPPHYCPFVFEARTLSITAANIPIPVHKSNLQKAIRRGKREAALFSAWSMLHLDRMELLRRLPIIMVEDVTLFDRFPVLVWLMMATASPSSSSSSSSIEQYYNMTEHDVRSILAMIQYLAEQQSISFCAMFHDKEVLSQQQVFDVETINGSIHAVNECKSSESRTQNGEKEERERFTIWEIDRERGEELSSVIDQTVPIDNLGNTGSIDYRHLSHEEMELRIANLLSNQCEATLPARSAQIDCLLALFYRVKYGGMSGDMDLLAEAIEQLRLSNLKVETMPISKCLLWQSEPCNLELSLRPCYLLEEALDYHPLPQLTSRVHGKVQQMFDSTAMTSTNQSTVLSLLPDNVRNSTGTGITPELIQRLIWCIDSAPNIRRPRSFRIRQDLLSGENSLTWKKYIAPVLQRERRRLLEMYTSNTFSATQITNYFQHSDQHNARPKR